MAAFDYAGSAALADKLITRFGQSAVLRSHGAVTGSPDDPTIGSPVDVTVRVVALDFNDREIDGVRVLRSDRKVYLSTSGVSDEPTTDHRVLIDSVDYAIIDVSPFNPGGTVTHYMLQCRR